MFNKALGTGTLEEGTGELHSKAVSLMRTVVLVWIKDPGVVTCWHAGKLVSYQRLDELLSEITNRILKSINNSKPYVLKYIDFQKIFTYLYNYCKFFSMDF